MRLAGRYEKFRSRGAPRLRDDALRSLTKIPELEIQARWFAGEFGTTFKTIGGQEVQIVQFGVWNREAGPDFAEAAVSFENAVPIRGGIELDPDARDWERHGHAVNPDYESVVLHVFTQRGEADFFTRTADHRNVPQVLLDASQLPDLPRQPPPLLAKLGPCSAPLRALPREQVIEILEAAAQFRLQKKSAQLLRLSEAHGVDEALYQSLAATLGYKSNKLPFTVLAQRLPLRFLRKNQAEADALLFGLSGFLATRDWSLFDLPTRTYLKQLWEKWWTRRTEFEPLGLKKTDWRLSGLRPANHPQRRLAALAQIVRHWPKVRALFERGDLADFRKFFTALRDEYWDFHYTLTSPKTAARMALVGGSRVTEMLANIFFPWAIGRDAAHWETYRQLPAALSNQRVEIAAVRLFADAPRELLKTAARQQGLLQIYEDFCLQDASDCARCRFPRQLAQWR